MIGLGIGLSLASRAGGGGVVASDPVTVDNTTITVDQTDITADQTEQ